MFGDRTNVNVVSWIALAAWVQDSKKYYANFWPWLAIFGVAVVLDELDCRLDNFTPRLRTSPAPADERVQS